MAPQHPRVRFPRLRSAGKAARGFLLDVLYPESALCLVCGCAAVPSGCLCGRCRAALLEADPAFSWRFRDLNSVPAWSLRPHRGVPRSLVLALKHQAAACAAEELAALLDPLPGFFLPSPDTVVTWVSMPSRRRRERCIDHGRVLAEAMARKLNLPCRPLLIRRNDSSRTQASLNRRSREKNLRRAFAPLVPIDFPVLLVDDVLTTGTTALRCIEALQSAGAHDITILTATFAV